MELSLTREMANKIYDSIREAEMSERRKLFSKKISKEERARIETQLTETEEARDFFSAFLDEFWKNGVDAVKIVV